jgi:PST family polysaccharide transporter
MMALISAIALPLIMILIRNHIAENIGMQEAGIWEGMNRISSYYLMFVSSLMALYILPRLSEIESVKEFRKEIFSFYKTIIPIYAMCLLAIYFLRPFIISIVFSKEFASMEELFLWQLLGDFIKVLSIAIAYQFIEKKMYWHFIITEVFLVIMLYTTSIYFIDSYDVKGATIAHFVSYMMYYGVILLIFGTSLFKVEEE